MDTLDIALRLGAATLVGIVLGLNRDLHGKPTGVRTLGVLCLGSAMAVLSIHTVTGSDASCATYPPSRSRSPMSNWSPLSLY